MKRNRKIALLSLGIALYAVLSAFVIIPIVNRIKLDLGYVVFGLYLNKFGIAAAPVGVIGCIIGNMLKGGSFPIAWAIGQLFIALTLGFFFRKQEAIHEVSLRHRDGLHRHCLDQDRPGSRLVPAAAICEIPKQFRSLCRRCHTPADRDRSKR